MKKYENPKIETFLLEDVLADSDQDNCISDPADENEFDPESPWLVAD